MGKYLAFNSTFGTRWDEVGIERDVAVGTSVGTDRDEVGMDWDEGGGGTPPTGNLMIG